MTEGPYNSTLNIEKPDFTKVAQRDDYETLMTTRRETSSDEAEIPSCPLSPVTLNNKHLLQS